MNKDNRKKMKIKKSLINKIIMGVCTFIILFFLITFLYPVIYVVVSSVSTVSMRFQGSFIPQKISFEGFRIIFENCEIWRAFLNSVLYTTVGTTVSLMLSILIAYVLSVRNFYLNKVIMLFLVGTLYFSGGMIPTYILLRKLGLLNTMWSLILPHAISVYNVFLLKTHFQTKISQEIYEAASIDGCGHFMYLIRFAIPLSKALLQVIMLFYAVSYWNSYFEAMIYITDKDKQPLSIVLNNILIKNQNNSLNNVVISKASDISSIERMQLTEYALIIVSVIPILLIMFFVRKSFGEVNFRKKDKER